VRFHKLGRLRFLGHLDLGRLLMRALRRAGIPLVYSQGFNPKPKVAFGPALPVGVRSDGEYFDFETHERLDPETAVEAINGSLPSGVRFLSMRAVPRDQPALGESVRAARYRVHPANGFDLAGALERFQARAGITVRRRRKNGKIREFELGRELLGLEPLDDGSLRFTLALHGSDASVRPEEALRELFGEAADPYDLVREELLVDWNGRLVNPMLAASASHGHRATG
jgi:radical SAM-linked protein